MTMITSSKPPRRTGGRNGSLVETTPGGQAGNEGKRYRYNAAGQLTQVEAHDGTSYQAQAEMVYNGQQPH